METKTKDEITHEDEEAITCDALCKLSAGDSIGPPSESAAKKSASAKSSAEMKLCPKQFQLPMFLSKTYHMIEKCDSEIACWAEGGESFIIKNLEKFASDVLPRYFKHSNFSSFARQLNFYGFRKLRTDPILITVEGEAETASYVRFYHANFQKDKPELMQNIRRATKGGENHTKDDFEVLRQEVGALRQKLTSNAMEYDRKLAELSYDFNRRISAMNAEYDKLAALVQNSARQPTILGGTASAAPQQLMLVPTTLTGAQQQLQMPVSANDFLQQLSQAAVSIQEFNRSNKRNEEDEANRKRQAERDDDDNDGPSKSRAKST